MPSFTATPPPPRSTAPPVGCASAGRASLPPHRFGALVAITCALAPIALVGSGCSLMPSFGSPFASSKPDADAGEIAPVNYEEPVAARTEPGSIVDSLHYLDPAGLVSKKPNKPDEAKRIFAQAQALFLQGDELLKAGDAAKAKPKLANAAKLYRSAAALWIDSALEQDALFMAGEANFFADRYAYANDAFEALIGAYPNTRHLDVVAARRFAIAKYWVELDRVEPQSFFTFNFTDQRRPWRDTFGNAVRVYDRIRIDDITGRLADDATMAAGNAYFEKGDFEQADQFYTDLRQQFPASDHLFKAYFLDLKAKIESYRGQGYDATVLDEAEELLREMMKRFPAQVQEEREYLEKAAAEIRYRKAEIEWRLGGYYERRYQYGGARYHYQIVVDDYAGTPFEPQAQARLDAIKDYPDRPAAKYDWIRDLLEDDPLRIPPANPGGSAASPEAGASSP